MKRTFLCAVVLFVLALATPWPAAADSLRVDPLTDGLSLAGGVAAAGLSELLGRVPPPWGGLGGPDIGSVNGLDRAALFSYSHGLDLASTILQYSTLAAPVVFALVLDPGDFITMGIIYGQAISYAFAVKNVLKYLLPRYRPYVYNGGAPGVDSTEDDQSFPSGHATVVFAAATAGVTIYAMMFPGSPWFVPFTIASYGMAVLTASFRVASGMHFVTDVVAGAALGSAFGYLVPLLHRQRPSEGSVTGLSLETTGPEVLIRYRY